MEKEISTKNQSNSTTTSASSSSSVFTPRHLNKPLPQILFGDIRERPRDRVAVKFKRDGQWRDWNWQEFVGQVEAFAAYLSGRSIGKGSPVAIFAETCVEWAVCDLAIQALGAVTVPIYANSTVEELRHILEDCKAVALIVDSRKKLSNWPAMQTDCPYIREILTITDGGFANAVKAGESSMDSARPAIAAAVAAIQIDDVATIVYTSGTSGLSKGVVLSHRQILSEVSDVADTFHLDHSYVTLSFLPYAHVLGRLEMWLAVSVGFTICFAESIDALRRNLVEVSPTVLIAVPRIFEKVYAAIAGQIEARPILNTVLSSLNRISPHLTQKLKGKLLASRLRSAFGGRLKFAISGGARLDPEIGIFFAAAGLPIYEGYGLTETTGAITVNTPEHCRFGTVGRPLPDVKLRLAADGEILVKSDKVMVGYYHLSENPFHDGFFPTGDIGKIDAQGFLTITDRKKDLIKTSGGKYVAPQKLENALKRSPLISQALIHGDLRKYIVALITLNEPETQRWARQHSLTFTDFAALTRTDEVREMVGKIVAEANSQLASYESIKKFLILPKDFTVEAGELTPSLKIKRKFCDEKYRAQIDSLY